MLGTDTKATLSRLNHNGCACVTVTTTHAVSQRHTLQINQLPSRALQTEWGNEDAPKSV